MLYLQETIFESTTGGGVDGGSSIVSVESGSVTSADASASVSVASTFGAVGSGGRHRGGSGHKRLAVRMQPVVLQKYRAIGLPGNSMVGPDADDKGSGRGKGGGGGVEYTRRLRVRVQDLGTGVAVSGVVEELKLPSKNIVDEQEEEEDDNSNGVFNVKALVEKTIIQDAIEGAIKSVTWDERERETVAAAAPATASTTAAPMLDAVYEEGTASSSLSSPSSSSSSSLASSSIVKGEQDNGPDADNNDDTVDSLAFVGTPRVVARRTYVLCARDLLPLVPSLQVDAVNHEPRTAQDPSVNLAPAVAPSAVSGLCTRLPERVRRPGASTAEMEIDGGDSACYWEEVRSERAARSGARREDQSPP